MLKTFAKVSLLTCLISGCIAQKTNNKPPYNKPDLQTQILHTKAIREKERKRQALEIQQEKQAFIARMEKLVLESPLSKYPASKQLLEDKSKLVKMGHHCDKNGYFSGAFEGSYKLDGGQSILALKCAQYITGAMWRLFLVNKNGIINTKPLQVESVDVSDRRKYTVNLSEKIHGFAEYNETQKTLKFMVLCRVTAGYKHDFATVYGVANNRLLLKELWIDQRKNCGDGPADLQRIL